MTTETNPSTQNDNGRNPVVLFGGFAVLIILTVAIFAGSLIGNDDRPASVTEVEQPQASVVQLPTDGGPLQVGDLPYNFALKDLSGNTVQLSDFIGQPVLVNFWATWCGPCRIEMPELQAAFEAYKDEGLVILALDQDETPGEAKAYFDELGLTFTPILDDDKLTADNYGTFGSLPSSYFINPDGEITVIHRGPMVREQLESYLAQTIPNRG
jgi:peroxiredoxin